MVKKAPQGEQGLQGVDGAKGEPGEQGTQGNIHLSAIIGYIILAFGASFGIWYSGHYSSQQLKENVNQVVTSSCINELKPTSNTNKFNDLIDSLIITRVDARNEAKARGDIELVRINQAAIKRYHENKIVPKTVEQCKEALIP